jgi:hypothetical protein
MEVLGEGVVDNRVLELDELVAVAVLGGVGVLHSFRLICYPMSYMYKLAQEA